MITFFARGDLFCELTTPVKKIEQYYKTTVMLTHRKKLCEEKFFDMEVFSIHTHSFNVNVISVNFFMIVIKNVGATEIIRVVVPYSDRQLAIPIITLCTSL